MSKAKLEKLRKRYEELYGKKPFGAWKEDKLKEKIVEAEQLEAEQRTSADELPTVEAGVEEYTTGEDLKPPLEDGLKTDKEVIEEAQEKDEIPSKQKFTKELGGQILDSLYHRLRDGRYRRRLLDIREREISKRSTFIEELEQVYALVAEGELKGVVRQYITNL